MPDITVRTNGFRKEYYIELILKKVGNELFVPVSVEPGFICWKFKINCNIDSLEQLLQHQVYFRY